MYLVVLVVHILVSLSLIGFILLQHGKGADAGVAFGASSSGGGSQNMGMTKFIGSLAVAFFATSLALGFLSGHNQIVDYAKRTLNIDVAQQAADVTSEDPGTTKDLPVEGVPSKL